MPELLHDILAEIKSLEPLPQVAMRVVELASHEDVIPGELVAVIQTDAAITAKVLKLCNSALFGFQREIASLSEAGNLLGVTTLVNLVLTSCAGRYFRDYGRGDARAAQELWERSVASALAASLLARIQGRADKNRAYTGGLLANVGQLVLQRFLPEERTRLQRAIEHGATALEAEREVLGLDHAEIGARLAERWNFPELLIDTIRHHHEPQAARVDPVLAALAHLGEVLGSAAIHGSEAGELDPRALTLAGLRPAALEGLEDRLRTELAKAREVAAV